jgi:mRNA interferase RelE/StbE
MSRARVYLDPEAHEARGSLPGHVRQRVKRTIDALADEPRPPGSQALDTEGLEVPRSTELRRIRLGSWRIVYAVNSSENWVWILALRRRPPYDYEDLATMLDRLR